MSLNIKNEEAERLARELAHMTGETVTAAVTAALRDRIERERHERRRKGRSEDLAAIAADCARRLKGRKMMEINDLYDETGLPK